MSRIVDISVLGLTFRVVDPALYPFANYEHTDELPFKARHWLGLAPGDVVLDAGASFGGWTLPALAQGAHVVAVEPSPVSGAILLESADANGWLGRLTLVRTLLWDSTPVPEEFRAAAVRNFGGGDDVGVMTLDALAAEWPRLDRIKLDVEGAEAAVIRGGRRALRRLRPRVVIEDHDKPADAPEAPLVPYAVGLRERTTSELRALGYEVTCEYGEGGGNPYIVGRMAAQ